MNETAPDQDRHREYEAFIGNNAAHYVAKFRKFNVDGVENFQATWNWPAFLFTFWWMLYRKMYIWALAVFIALHIPYAGFIAWIACGLGGNYVYYRFVRGRVEEARAAHPPDLIATLRQLGGTHEWVKIVGVVVTLLGIFVLVVVGGLISLLGG